MPSTDSNWPMNPAEADDLYRDFLIRAEHLTEAVYRAAVDLEITAEELDFFINGETSSKPGLPDAALMALPKATLVEEMLNGEEHTDCSICVDQMCLGEEVIQVPSCKHLFHSKCILDWSQYQKTCPLCRGELTVGKKDSEKK